MSVLLGQQYTAAGTPTVSRLLTPPHVLPKEASAKRWVTEVRGWSESKEGPAGAPNTDSPLAGSGQGGDAAQILSSQKKKKMARNRNKESCQLEAG